MVRYLFRKPKYPLLIETDGRVAGVRNERRFEKIDKKVLFSNKESYIVIDSSGEGWKFFPEDEIISPLTVLKRWSKRKIIDFFNASLDKTGSSARCESRSLSNKRLERVILEIIEFESSL
ncbi:hypothetical protein CKO23_15320 [Thiocystis violacea]|nr:hypothetical protein [Thiocystis violacea]